MKRPPIRYLYEKLHPDLYHGHDVKHPFFEGWYFKLVDAARENAWAVIPGIYRDSDPMLDHAFVMLLDGRSHHVTFIRYLAEDFAASRDKFLIRVGPNFFGADFLTLNLSEVRGHLTFSGITPWPVSWTAPGIMGWYAWFPMECYHGVVSMDHALSGCLTCADAVIDFSGGRGYIEKDWGRNFPQTWIWLQANHFDTPEVSLTASIARIPFYGRVFPGFIIGLKMGDRLYRFATYLGATLDKVVVDGTGNVMNRVEIVVTNKQYRLQINAERGATALLYAPTPGQGMVPRVKESLTATVRLHLSDRRGAILFAGESSFAGMEIEGDTQILQVGPLP